MDTSKNSLIASHTGYYTKAGDQPDPGSPLWSLGRALLGVLKNRLSLGGVAVGSQSWTLPDGTRIDALISPGIYKVVFLVPRLAAVEVIEITYSPIFLYYEKIAPYLPYGYKLMSDGTLANRSTAYQIGESIDSFMGEFKSITEQTYIGDSGSFKMAFGLNPRYGNQYVFIPGEPPTVYSWWHSPFGDWPHIVFPSFSEFMAADMRYMPAYVEDNSFPGYYYITENPLFIQYVPVTLYKNGVDFYEMGQPGQSMIAGVGQRDDGDVLVAVVTSGTVTLSALRSGQEIVIGTLYSPPSGTPILDPIYQVAPWRFNDGATRVASICQPDPYNGVEGGLAVYEFTIEKNSETGEYTVTLIDIRPMPGTVTSNTTQTNQKSTTSVPFVPPRGTRIYGTTRHTIDVINSDVNTTTVHNIPVAVYYDRRESGDTGYQDNPCKLVIIEKTVVVSQQYFKDNSSYNSGGSWNNIFPYHKYLSETKTVTWSRNDTKKTKKTTETASLLYVDDRGNSERIPLYDFEQAYKYYILVQDDYNRSVLYTSYQANVCSPTNILYSSVIDNKLNQIHLNEASDHLTLTGTRYQVRHFDARLHLLVGFKTTMNSLKERTWRIPFTFYTYYRQTRTHECGQLNPTTVDYTEEGGTASVYKVLGTNFAIAENDVADYEIFDRVAPALQIPPQVILVNYVNDVAIDNRTKSYLKVNDVLVSGSKTEYIAIKSVSNNVSSPSWANFTAPFPATNEDWSYNLSTVTGATYARWDNPEEFSKGSFKGSGSARPDPTQYIDDLTSLNILSAMYTKKDFDRCVYTTSEQGTFGLPLDTLAPHDHVPESGTPNLTVTVLPFPGTRDALHIIANEGTLHPIGWRFEEEED